MTTTNNNLIEEQAKEFLKKVFSSITKVEDSQLDLLINLFDLVSFKKNYEIIKEGEVAEYFYFIYKGIIKIYYFKEDKPVIDRFEKEGTFFGGNFTHITKKPGTHIYESIEDVVLLKIKYDDLDELCSKSHDIERLYRISMELFHTNYGDKISAFKALSSEKRYKEFLIHYGDVSNRVPLKDIANYLNMTPETLSRIRAKYDKR